MKTLQTSIALAALMLGLHATAHAGGRDALLDTGNGGFKLLVAVPDFAEGPYDFAKGKGPKTDDQENFTYAEVRFDIPIGESALLAYQSTALHSKSGTPAGADASAETLAANAIKAAGFEGRARLTERCPKLEMEDAKVRCYTMTGEAIFAGKPRPGKFANVLVAISFANDTNGYTLMTSLAEKDVAKFDENPVKYEAIATRASIDLYRSSLLNP